MATHALVTGNTIAGRIPVDHPDHPDGFIDVTPPVLYFEHDDEDRPPDGLLAAADAIEDEHWVRQTHPVQLSLQALNDPEQYPVDTEERRAAVEQLREQHWQMHAEVQRRVVARSDERAARRNR